MTKAITRHPSTRLLVLGSDNHGRNVTAYRWSDVPAWLNVADFDAVILNFSQVGRDANETTVSDRLPQLENFVQLIFSNPAAIIAVGNPASEFEIIVEGPFGPRTHTTPVTWWLPVRLPFRIAVGQMLSNIDETWQFWFDHVRSYTWHFWEQAELLDALRLAEARKGLSRAEAFVGIWSPLAETRAGSPVAIRLKIVAPAGGNPEGAGACEDIFWLPTPTEIDDHEAVDFLIRSVLGVAAEEPVPEWMEAYLLPREVEAIEKADARRAEAEEAESALHEAEERAREEARFGRLLYERGQEALEPVVRESLSILGASVEEPKAAGIEDGRITDPRGRKAMLEIKGKTGQLKVDDVRQLDDWIRTAMANEGWDGKGIVVANLKLREPPEQRTDLVGAKALDFARRARICILPTSQLYAALEADQNKTLDRKKFWDHLFETSGIAALPDPTARSK